ncbi:DUF1376 domain-containing protein [Klebsiella pneumoniae]|uniref:DUF1376 domain-containing protein n=1 Tax=Klebsiella pneumoniae TaxID=573 RepID=UPI000DE645C3|nr:DUF1376 domain-containing protein [Klebsiella pneumoniae]SSH14169.1 primosomal protein I [Klebsiella pneumoniae]HDZ1288593.1 DUF1376 domain-containing protein [Klebsiella pneumoniae]
MAALPYMQLYIADYLADTMHLSTEEHGAYLLLMFNYWQTGRAIPKSRLSKIARLSNDRWSSVESSLKEFFNDNGTEWVHERIERDLEMVRSSQRQKSDAGKASAKARKAKKSTTEQREGNDRSTGVDNPFEQNGNGNPTNKDPDIDTDLKENPEREIRASDEISPEEYLPGTFPAPLGKFPVTKNWTPDIDFCRRAALWGINLGQDPGYTAEELQQFRDYWSPEGKIKHQQQWEQTFAQSLRTSRTQSSRPGTGVKKPALPKISKPSTTIPSGFRG